MCDLMIIAITGTPGTGKSTVSSILAESYHVIHLNEIVKVMGFYSGIDEKRGSLEVEMDELEAYLREALRDHDEIIVEGHLAHLLDAGYDIVIVLRCRPSILRDRLRSKGFNEDKVRENLEAEALDVILIEALEGGFDAVYEIDTTERTANEVAACIKEIVEGNVEEYLPGRVSWGDELEKIVDELLREGV
ncbi:MAG: adenylate kinase [Candidatus Syntrophoarchaeum butanivorans]|uniref:Putative adenylate kinase n=2 Tax=Candidatus Syntropharchaeum butanivorans TaxID=1839936 RepID=A0A1F2P3L3_9EURY|nr:MAG: adenylate kinase [Candidatus Syntrophoarchaeum butanivorans]